MTETSDPFGAYARFYDLDHAGFDDDLLLVQELAARCGSPLLELGCGTGRLLVPLARLGYLITGVDVSPAMLSQARHKVEAAGLGGRVSLVQQDMRELSLKGRFKLAFCAINTFQHLLTTADQLAVLRCIYRQLEPGGLLLLDLFNPDPAYLADARGQVILDKVMADPTTGRPLIKLQSQTADVARQTIEVTVMVDDVDDEGVVRRSLFAYSMRYLCRAELELLIGQAGFELEEVYGSYDLEGYSADSDKLIAIARRPV